MSNNALDRTVDKSGRTVLAMDCALAGAEKHHGRPLNSVVRHLENSGVKWALP